MSLDHVHHVVAELFAVVHHVHVVHAHLVAVFLILDIHNVLLLENLAVIVDFVLEIQRMVDIHLLRIVEHGNHVRQSLVAKVHDVLDMVVLFFGEIFLAAELAVDGTGHVVASIADAFDFGNFPKHRLDGRLAFGAQAAFAYFVQVVRDFDFHVVTDALVLLDAGEQSHEVILVLHLEQVGNEVEHLLRTGREQADFLAGLKQRKFGSSHEAGTDEVQAGIFFLFGVLGLDNPAHELLDKLDEPDLYEGVRDVERGVERREHHGNLREVRRIAFVARAHREVVAHHVAHGGEEPLEHDDDPDNAYHVNRKVGQGGAARLRIGGECNDVRRNRRTDVLAEHEHDALVDVEHAGRAEDHRDGHDGRRRLHAEGEHRTHHQEEQGIEEVRVAEVSEERADGSARVRILHNGEARFLEGRKTEEEEADAEQELAQHTLLVQVHEDDTDEERRVDEVRDVEREPEAHDPCGYRRTDVGSEDNRDGLHERQEPRINKRDRHQRGGGRTLY